MSKVDIINDLQGALLTFFIKTKKKVEEDDTFIKKKCRQNPGINGL